MDFCPFKKQSPVGPLEKVANPPECIIIKKTRPKEIEWELYDNLLGQAPGLCFRRPIPAVRQIRAEQKEFLAIQVCNVIPDIDFAFPLADECKFELRVNMPGYFKPVKVFLFDQNGGFRQQDLFEQGIRRNGCKL